MTGQNGQTRQSTWPLTSAIASLRSDPLEDVVHIPTKQEDVEYRNINRTGTLKLTACREQKTILGRRCC
jgi:hypothetical protein